MKIDLLTALGIGAVCATIAYIVITPLVRKYSKNESKPLKDHSRYRTPSRMLDDMKKHTAKADLNKKERKALGRVYRQELVKRSALKRIAAAWVITVPASALISAVLFFTIRGMMLP